MQIQLTKNRYENLDALDEAFEQGYGYDAIDQIIAVKRMVGIILAKALWLGNHHWDSEDKGETFPEYAIGKGLVRDKATVRRYINAWQAILDAPPEIQKDLIAKDMKSLIPIGTNIANGEIEPDENDWQEFVDAADHVEVSDMVREMRGVEKKSTISLTVNSDGDIQAWSNGENYYIGYLDVHSRDRSVVDKSINRIINKAGIKEK